MHPVMGRITIAAIGVTLGFFLVIAALMTIHTLP
jgi:hypothetical protein